jgi:23S rRNA (guanosine2251-2'-O)-methyltransferase
VADWIYGRNPILEALRSGEKIEEIWVAEGIRYGGAAVEILDLARSRHIPFHAVARKELERRARAIGGVGAHQGMIARLAPFAYVDLEDILGASEDGNSLVLVLDCVQDVHNLGSLLRTAEAAGVNGVVLLERRAAGVTPAVRKASAGAVEHLRIAQVGNLVRAMKKLKEAGLWIVGLDPDAQKTCWEVDLIGSMALVVGSEGSGMRRLVRETCDVLVRLPMWGGVSSLNAAVAGSIVLYEVRRQRERSL